MSSERAIRRNMRRAPQPPPVAARPGQTTQEQLATQNYRVRRLIIKAELDIYDKDGVLKERGLTDDLVIMEADFPQPLMAYFIGKGMLKEGFKTYKPEKPKPVPPPQE